jgi:hypothetical protein
MDPQKVAALKDLADNLGKLENDAFRLDQGRIFFLIARARNEVEAIVLASANRPQLKISQPR